MPHPRSRLALVVAAALVAATALQQGTRSEAASPLACAVQASDAPPHCCFTNARYVGTCEVAPTKDVTCAAILDYLNNPQSQGKSYCGNTSIRGGWQQVPCEPKAKQD